MKYLRPHLFLLVPMIIVGISLIIQALQAEEYVLDGWKIIGILLNVAVFCFTTAHYISEVKKDTSH